MSVTVGPQITLGRWSKRSAIALIVLVGLLNFHIPHFMIEARSDVTSESSALELVFVVNLLGALIAAIGISRNLRWAWILGVLIAALSFVLYVTQETVGLPGLPKNWGEPSRVVSLIVEGFFVVLAYRQLSRPQRATV